MTPFEKTVKMVATPLAVILWIYATLFMINIAILFGILIYCLVINCFATLSSLLPILS